MKMHMKVFKFILSLEEHSVHCSNEKQLPVACFCLTTGLFKFYHTSAQMGIPCIKWVLDKFSKLTVDTSSKIDQEYIANETDHQILHSCILLTI